MYKHLSLTVSKQKKCSPFKWCTSRSLPCNCRPQKWLNWTRECQFGVRYRNHIDIKGALSIWLCRYSVGWLHFLSYRVSKTIQKPLGNIWNYCEWWTGCRSAQKAWKHRSRRIPSKASSCKEVHGGKKLSGFQHFMIPKHCTYNTCWSFLWQIP